MSPRIPAFTWIALTTMAISWFWMATLVSHFGPVQHVMHFYDLGTVLLRPSWLVHGTARWHTLQAFAFGALSAAILLAPLMAHWLRTRSSWLLYAVPLAFMLVCGGALYLETSGPYVAASSDAGAVGAYLARWANEVIRTATDTIAKHISIGAGGYGSFLAAVCLTFRGVREYLGVRSEPYLQGIRIPLLSIGFVFGLLADPPAIAGSYSVADANAYVGRQDWSGLVRYSHAWAEAEPQAAMPWYYLGNTYGIGLNQPTQAVPAFEKAVALQPHWPEAWNALGHANVQLKRYDAALTAFTHAVEQAPERANYCNSLAAVYSYENRPGLTVKALEGEQRALAHSNSYLEWYNLANGFNVADEPKAAAAAYRKSLQLNPRYAPAWNNLGSLELSNGDSGAALADFQRAGALGDTLGVSNQARLQQAIAAAAAQQRPLEGLAALEHTLSVERNRRAADAWQEHLGQSQTH